MPFPSNPDHVLVEHVLDCLGRIREYTAGDKARFDQSRLVQDAVLRNLQVLAESTQRLSNVLKQAHPEIPWRSIAGFRNILVHNYLGIDLEATWRVVEADLPPLEEAFLHVREEVGRSRGPGERDHDG